VGILYEGRGSFNTEGTEGGAQRSQRRESESRTGAGLSDEKAARREARVERSFNTEGTEGGAQRSQRRENGSRTGVGLSNDRVAKSYRVGCGVSVLPSGSSGASSRRGHDISCPYRRTATRSVGINRREVSPLRRPACQNRTHPSAPFGASENAGRLRSG